MSNGYLSGPEGIKGKESPIKTSYLPANTLPVAAITLGAEDVVGERASVMACQAAAHNSKRDESHNHHQPMLTYTM